jgi:hypothetical protein
MAAQDGEMEVVEQWEEAGISQLPAFHRHKTP